MGRFRVAVVFLGVLIPAFASAQFNYTSNEAGYSTTQIKSDPLNPNLDGQTYTELSAGISREISANAYVGGSVLYGNANRTSTAENVKVYSVAPRAGYHKPINDRADLVVEGQFSLGKAYQAGTTKSANSYDFGAGVRAVILPGLEGSLGLYHGKSYKGPLSTINTYLKGQFGFFVTPHYQFAIQMDFRPELTAYMRMRYFY